MTDRNWKHAKDQLATLVAKPLFGLISDLDGTLSSITQRPEESRITPRNLGLLSELQSQLPLVAIISGRSASWVQMAVGLSGVTYIGNHGLERWENGRSEIIPEAVSYLAPLKSAKKEMGRLQEHGVLIEDKGATISLHYRQVEDPSSFSRQNAKKLARIAEDQSLVLFTGKMVFEMRPPIPMDKGIAFRQLVVEKEIEAALFLGDDVSDLAALKVARQLRAAGECDAWGIGVQSPEAPDALAETADFLADGVGDVEDLLAWLLKARKASST